MKHYLFISEESSMGGNKNEGSRGSVGIDDPNTIKRTVLISHLFLLTIVVVIIISNYTEFIQRTTVYYNTYIPRVYQTHSNLIQLAQELPNQFKVIRYLIRLHSVKLDYILDLFKERLQF